MTEGQFCVRHKNRRKHNQHFELPFFMINLHFGTLNIKKKKFFLTSSIYLVFSSLRNQRRLAQTNSKVQVFYSVWKETTHKLSKFATAKNVFSSLYGIGATCFKCFLFHVITGRYSFLIKVYLFNRHILALF